MKNVKVFPVEDRRKLRNLMKLSQPMNIAVSLRQYRHAKDKAQLTPQVDELTNRTTSLRLQFPYSTAR